MKTLLKMLAVVGVLMFGIANAYAADAAKTELQPIKIGQWGKEKVLLYLPLYVAMEEGYFAKNGLNPEIIFTGNDDQTFASVISGDIDFGFADPVFTALAVEKGLKAKTVAVVLDSLGLSGYTDKPAVKMIEKPADLSGLRVGSFPQPSTTYTLLNQLKTQNPELNGMTIVEGAIGTQAAMLQADKLDIAVDFEPMVSQMEAKGDRVVFDLTKFMPKQAITGLTVTQKTIDNNPALVQKTVNAMQEAVTAMYKDPAVAYRVSEKLFPNLSKDVVKHAVDRMLKAQMYPSSIAVKDDEWQRNLRTRLDSGELKKPQATNVAVDNRFAEKAK